MGRVGCLQFARRACPGHWCTPTGNREKDLSAVLKDINVLDAESHGEYLPSPMFTVLHTFVVITMTVVFECSAQAASGFPTRM